MEKISSSIKAVFGLLMATFILILGEFFIPVIRDLFRGLLFLAPLVVFSLLGMGLIFLTLKKKTKGILKKFLLLTGASAAGFFVNVALHNGFYALGTITEHIVVLNSLLEGLGVAFFLLAIPVCPLGFLVGATGSMVLFFRRKKSEE